MRGSSEVISTVLMTSVTIVIGLAFLAFISGVLPGIASESNRMSLVNEAMASVDAVLVYSGRQNDQLVYVIDVMNLAGSELTVYVSVVAGKLASTYPVIKGAGGQLYIMRAQGETSIERCLSGLPDCARVISTAQLGQVRLVEDIPLRELGSANIAAPVAKLTIGPRGSKTIVATLPESQLSVYNTEPILLIMVSHNNIYYLASYRVLPSR